jgi:hypothetical protein
MRTEKRAGRGRGTVNQVQGIAGNAELLLKFSDSKRLALIQLIAKIVSSKSESSTRG